MTRELTRSLYQKFIVKSSGKIKISEPAVLKEQFFSTRRLNLYLRISILLLQLCCYNSSLNKLDYSVYPLINMDN
jgi:hypothetical protein